MSRRVVVTGMGAITPIGLSVDEFWAGVKEGKLGFAPITKFDAADFKCKLAAEVKGFEGKITWISRRLNGWSLFPNMR